MASPCATSSLLKKYILLEVLSRLRHILGPSEIPPIIIIGAKAEDFFSVSSQAQIGVDDGKNSVFTHHRKKARRNYVDSRKSQRLHLLGGLNKFGFLVA